MAAEVGFGQSGDVGRKLPIAILRHDRVRFVTRPSTAWCADALTRRLLLPPPMLMTCARWLRHPGGPGFQRLGSICRIRSRVRSNWPFSSRALHRARKQFLTLMATAGALAAQRPF